MNSPVPPLADRESASENGLCPQDLTGLNVEAPKTVAAGFTAVGKSLAHVFGTAGVLRGSRLLSVLNQSGGIDCTSCAWPDPDTHRSSAEFCENGAKAIAWEADTRRIGREFFAKHSISELLGQSDYWHGQQGRLTEPLVRRAGATHYEPISWADAFALIGKELNALGSPDEAAFYTSGRASNEAAFLYQLFTRMFGTNNLPDCSNMCHESSGAALVPTVGIGKGTVKLDDFEKAQVILILGQNPGTNHPRMLTALQKAQRAGATIVAVNPLREAGLLAFHNPQEARGMLGVWETPLASIYHRVAIGGDQAFLKGLMKALLNRGAVDQRFIDDQTTGFPELVSSLKSITWEQIVTQSGLTREEIEGTAELLAKSDRIIACWAMGLTQQPHAVATIQEIVNLLLMRGSIGKPGAGLCPVRGHSNVQGDRTMGIWEHPPAWALEKLGTEFHFQVPTKVGFDTVNTIHAMHDGRVKVFVALGGNFLSATPDTLYTAAALKRTRLTVQIAIKLNRSHLVTGEQALILPCLGRTEVDRQASGEQFITTENSMGVVQSSRGRLTPASPHLKSETAIVAGIAEATLGTRHGMNWPSLAADYNRIRTHISRVVPGFENYSQKVQQPGGFYLPNPPREGRFQTPSAKANFTTSPLPNLTLEPGQLRMMTIRTHDQFNTTVYGLDDRYRGIKQERRVILLNAADAAERNLVAGETVTIFSHFRGVVRRAEPFLVVIYDIFRGNCATYFPETNVLVPIDSVAEKSNTPTSKCVIVTVEKMS